MPFYKFNGTTIHVSEGGPTRKISVKGEIITFEMHPYCGPSLLGKRGDVLKNQKPKHPFWNAVSLWAQQGQRMEGELCRWDHEPEEILKHLGGNYYRLIGYKPAIKGE